MKVMSYFRLRIPPVYVSYPGFILDKSIGINCPKRMENAKILIANTCKEFFALLIDRIHGREIEGAEVRIDGIEWVSIWIPWSRFGDEFRSDALGKSIRLDM